ncbi:hypothetical protein [Faecalibaculum rodentium]|uniref:hypothetical protein n=1 Tax=Faecalibaculum rodentium TaxID=1702221 RepID=UPI0023F06E5E|nr:hypothetical protein [Faecalibaculum rodentium]
MGFSLAVTVQTNLWKARLEMAQKQYGMWQGMRLDINEQDRDLLSHHALVTTIGTEEIYGLLETDEAAFVMGTADPAFYELANYHLIQGELPQTGSEILVETRVLDELGLAYVPGQAVTGVIQGEIRTFTVSGIMDNYSALRISGDRQPGMFVGQGSGMVPKSVNVFVRAENPGVIQDLKQDMPMLIRNVHVKERWEPFSPENTAWTILMMLAMTGSGLLILAILSKWIQDRRNDLVVMKSPGVSVRKIFRDLSRIIGLSVCLAGAICALWGIFTRWPLIVLLAALAVMAGEVLFLWGLLWRELRHIPATVNAVKDVIPELKPRRVSMKRVTPKRLGIRFLTCRRRSVTMMVLACTLQTGALAGVCLSLAETWQYTLWLQQKPDYILSVDSPGIQSFATGDSLQNLAEKLQTDNRFSAIDPAFVQLAGWTIPVKPGSLLERIRTDSGITSESRDVILAPPYQLPADSQERQLVSMISRPNLNLSLVENLNRELWESGNGVILYAPDMTVLAGDLYLAEDLDQPGQVESEGAYRTGDILELEDPSGKTVRTQIAGILRSSPPEMWFDELIGSGLAYTLYVAPAFFEYPVNRLHVTLSDSATTETAGVSLSAMAQKESVWLDNDSAAKQQGLDLFRQEETLYGVLICGLFLSQVLVLMNGMKKLQTQMDDYGIRLELAGASCQSIKKTICMARMMILSLLTVGGLGCSLVVCIVHTNFPINADQLRSLLPFLFVQKNPVGIQSLDLHLGIWLVPVVVTLMLLCAVIGLWLGRKKKQTY